MKRYRFKIWKVCLLSLLTMLLGGCNEHADPSMWDSVEKPWDGDLYLKLNVGVAENSNALPTRAIDGYENPIYETEKLQTLRVIIVKKGGENENDYVLYNSYYDFRNSLRDDYLRYKVDFSTNYRIYLIGNEGGLQNLNLNIEGDEGTLDPIHTLLTETLAKGKSYVNGTLENLVISARVTEDYIDCIIDNETSSSDKVNIPMTEIYDVTTIERPQTNQEEVKVEMTKDMFLTRAATKFSFTFQRGDGFGTDNGKNLPEIKSIKITGLSPKEYLFPNGTVYSPPQGNASTNEYGGREITEFNVPTEENTPRAYVFFLPPSINIPDLISEGSSYAPLLYFPESKGEATSTDSGNIDINNENFKGKFQCTISYDGKNYLTPVTLPNLDALPRNTHVKINIILHPHDMEAIVTLFPYTAVSLNPEFGFIIRVESVDISIRSQETGELESIKSLELREGESRNLIGTVSPHNANNQDLVWVSADSTAVSVSKIGMVTAKNLPEGASEATVSITAMAADGSGKSATCMVTVRPKILVESISISDTSDPDATSWTGNIGTTTSLTATISPSNATIQNVTWTSSNADVAIVSSYGVVTAREPGDAIITATATDGSGKYAEYKIHVNDIIPVISVTLSAGPSGDFIVGEEFSFDATVAPSNATNPGIIWSIDPDDSKVATVTDYGLVTAKEEGDVTIIATAADGSGQKASCEIHVTKYVPVDGIALSSGGYPGVTVTEWTYNPTPGVDNSVRATITPPEASYRGVKWTSSDTNVVTVEESRSGLINPAGCTYSIGKMTSHGKGTAVITATSYDKPDVKKSFTVTVN